MPETKWTDGPWTAREQEGGYGVWEIRADDGDTIIARVLADTDRPERTEADAHLMAAAPAMAEAIRKMVACLESYEPAIEDILGDNEDFDLEGLRAALALAEKGGG